MKRTLVKFVRRLVGTEGVREKLQGLFNSNLFRNVIEDCEWLKYKSFTPGGWALDNAGLYTLFRILNNVKPKNILEFGLGESSKLVHQYATFSENVQAVTIEHDNDFIQFFCNGIPKSINVNIQQFDKVFIDFNGFQTLTYKGIDKIFNKQNKFDFVIVDGPYGSKHYSRSQIIELVKNGNLSNQFCIFIDDSERNGEMDTIKEICNFFESAGTKFLIKKYIGEKNHHTIICSEDLKFLMSLK